MKSSFNVGDVCRIRSWEDMQSEFGLEDGVSINCDFSFVPSMRHLCGQQFTIERIENGELGIRCYSVEKIEGRWQIGTDMLELLYGHEFEGESIDALIACLGG